MSADPFSDRTPDSILDQKERAKRFRAESEQRQAEQAAQEQHQRARQARHQAEARRIDEETRAALHLRVMRMQEEAKPQPEARPVAGYSPRQKEELALEQAAGRRQLAKDAQRNQDAAAARERVSAEEKVKEDLPGFKT